MHNTTDNRHKDMLAALEKAWGKHPELSLGQLLSVLATPEEKPLSVLSLSDCELYNRLNGLLGDDSYIVPVWANLFHALGFSDAEAAELEALSQREILDRLEGSEGAAPREYVVGEPVWIAGVAGGHMTSGTVAYCFERYGELLYVIEVQTGIEPIYFVRDAWTIGDRPDVKSLGYWRA